MVDHFSSQIMIGKPIEVAFGYQMIPLVRIPLYVKPPLIRIHLIPAGFILISNKGIKYCIWEEENLNQTETKEDTL